MAASLKVLKTVDYETDKFMAAPAVYVELHPFLIGCITSSQLQYHGHPNPISIPKGLFTQERGAERCGLASM